MFDFNFFKKSSSQHKKNNPGMHYTLSVVPHFHVQKLQDNEKLIEIAAAGVEADHHIHHSAPGQIQLETI